MPRQHVLVVDADPAFQRRTCSNLQSNGYSAVGVASGEEALAMLAKQILDLVILDVELPGIDGFEVCRRIRELYPVPIIILTSLGTKKDKVKGLNLGADDYLTKPVMDQELMARVRAVLRRARLDGTPLQPTTFNLGDLQIDVLARRVILRGQEIALSPTEYRLLTCLAAQAGTLLTRDHLLEVVWEPSYRGRHEILRVTLWRLRRKLEEDPSHPRYIITNPGQGYMFAVHN